MIRLRIGKEFQTFSKEGLVWYKAGRTYRVVIEQRSQEEKGIADPKKGGLTIPYQPEQWVPVEVIDEV